MLRLWSDLFFNTWDDIIEKVFDSTYPNKDHLFFINTNDAKLYDQNYNVSSHCTEFELKKKSSRSRQRDGRFTCGNNSSNYSELIRL